MPHNPIHCARRWKTLAVLSLSLVIIGLDNTILNVAPPSLQEEFGASTLQWIVDAYLLDFAGLILTMGTSATASDASSRCRRVGPRGRFRRACPRGAA